MSFAEYLLYMFQNSWQFNVALWMAGTAVAALCTHYTAAAMVSFRRRFGRAA